MGQPHHHDLGLWGGKCHIFPRLAYDVDIYLLPKDLLYKDIPMTLYDRIENVMDRENVFIA
jgi:hypothetical protein